MQIRLFHKLFLAIVAVSLASIVLLAIGAQWYLQHSFVRFLNEERAQRTSALAGQLAGHYATHGGWQALQHSPRAWRRTLRAAAASTESARDDGASPPPRPPHAGRHRGGLALFDAERRLVAGNAAPPEDMELTPVILEQRTIGWIGSLPLRRPAAPREMRFARRQLTILSAGAAIACLLSIAVAYGLARRLAAPIRAIGDGARSLAAGDFGARVTVPGSDELGRLGADFNVLARTLERNESARQRWFADVSHELRTPLTILRGELEAVRDGIRPLDGALVESLDQETARLEDLIEDLYLLARADLGSHDYAFAPTSLASIVCACLSRFAHRIEQAGLRYDYDLDSRVLANVDERRLAQLVENLLENCVRYVAAPGTIRVTVGVRDKLAELCVEDSGPGPAQADLDGLFDPLVRGEASRSREHGGAGLGLAIARRIAEAHGGNIGAERRDAGHFAIVVRLPRLDQS